MFYWKPLSKSISTKHTYFWEQETQLCNIFIIFVGNEMFETLTQNLIKIYVAVRDFTFRGMKLVFWFQHCEVLGHFCLCYIKIKKKRFFLMRFQYPRVLPQTLVMFHCQPHTFHLNPMILSSSKPSSSVQTSPPREPFN